MSYVQEELFPLAFSGIIWQGKSHSTMLTESCISQNPCSFGDDIWAAVHELCLHSWQGLPEHLHCCRARGKRKHWCSQFSVGNVGSCVRQPLWFSGTFSVASHAHTPPSTSWGLAPAANLHKEWASWHHYGSLQFFLAKRSCLAVLSTSLWLWGKNTEIILEASYNSSYL